MKTYIQNLQLLVIAFLSIFVLFSSAEAQTGTLTGVVRNCSNNQPIQGALVSCGGNNTLTNATGNYTILNVPVGNQVTTATCAGYLPASVPCTISNGQTTTLNFCMNPQPGVLTGVITDCSTGLPVPGAKVSFATNYTYSIAGGYYSMSIYPGGTHALQVAKMGYEIYILNGVLVTPGDTTIVNVQLSPHFATPPVVTSALNTGQTAADISWTQPMSTVELGYDDYGAEECIIYANDGSISAVKFTPCDYPVVLRGFNVHICASNTPLQANAYNADGPGGTPGSLLGGSIYFTPTYNSWNRFDFSSPVTITSGSFFIGIVQLGTQPSSRVSMDTTSNQLRSFQKIDSGPWIPANGNIMIHAILDEPCGIVPPGNITYTVSRLLQGQENAPAAWTQLGSVTGSYTMTDNSWPSLSCGAYRWAVKPSFTCSANNSPGFSNVIGKCWTANVAFHGQKCCDSLPKEGMIIHAQNLDVPDSSYTVVTDTSGSAAINNMWKGHYAITSALFGCAPVNFTVTINGDTTINVIMTTGNVAPPTGLFVNDTTLLATWNKPKLVSDIFNETWASGSFTSNQWTVSGGSNWQIATGIGQPAPSAMFNWQPQVQNYDQYLTSKTITGLNSPVQQLSYDIQLNNYGTNTINSLAVEVWDGGTWNVLKTYDNQGGSIPWTSEALDISTYSNQSFKIRFHAFGADSYDINWWNVDNIKITASTDLPCILGYNFQLNNILSGFVTDTFYNIPSNEVLYGQTYNACVRAVYGYNPAFSPPDCYTFTNYYLPPPFNFHADSIGCDAYLTWEHPRYTDGSFPQNLLGYMVYRQGALIAIINDPNAFHYYDFNLNPGTYEYGARARYDISGYIVPKYSGIVKDTTVIACGVPIPFNEGWNQCNFNYNGWTFDPSQGNWEVTSMYGNPVPTADFSWSGKMKSLNYNNAMVSPAIDGSQWSCSELFLGFDLKLVDRNSTSTEKMTIEIYYDNAWHFTGEFLNSGSTDWETKTYSIDQVRGKGFKIRFRAHGDNSANILHWYIDNINVYGNCLPPVGLDWTATAQQVNLFWGAPCSSISGYDIFRSDSAGNPPFTKANAIPVTGTAYTDVPPGWSLNDTYRYYVTAIQMNNQTNQVLCEAASDTILVAFPTGISESGGDKITIYPNPSDNYLIVKSEVPVITVQLRTNPGYTVFSGLYNNTDLKLNLSDYSPGVYFVRISTLSGTYFRKIVIFR